jgi:hypothetical protein
MTFALRIIMVAEFDRDVSEETRIVGPLENIDAVPEETWWNWIVLVSSFVPSGSQLWPFCKRKDPSSTKSRPMLVDTRTVFLRTC